MEQSALRVEVTTYSTGGRFTVPVNLYDAFTDALLMTDFLEIEIEGPRSLGHRGRGLTRNPSTTMTPLVPEFANSTVTSRVATRRNVPRSPAPCR